MEIKSVIAKALGIICIIAAFACLTALVSGIAALCELGALKWLISKYGAVLIGTQIEFTAGTIFFVVAARNYFKNKWRKATILLLAGCIIAGAAIGTLEAMRKIAHSKRAHTTMR
jgi:hypothetical protein